jgi:hypothetical protein
VLSRDTFAGSEPVVDVAGLNWGTNGRSQRSLATGYFNRFFERFLGCHQAGFLAKMFAVYSKLPCLQTPAKCFA